MTKNSDNILKKTLITGVNGMVGSYVDFGFKMDHRALDITDLNDAISVCKKYMPKVIIHLAAETDVGRCERDPQHAYFVNSIGTYNMCVAAKEVGAKFVYVSTSAVFNALKTEPYKETDEPDPQTYYGRSKFLGEIIVKNVLKDYVIARAAWMFGGGPKKDQKFIAKIIEQTRNKEINVTSNRNLKGSPTYSKDLINSLKKLIIEDKRGIFHLSNAGTSSRLDVAKEIVKITNSKSIINEVSPELFNSVESKRKISNESMISKIKTSRPWQEALKEYIQNEWPEYINK